MNYYNRKTLFYVGTPIISFIILINIYPFKRDFHISEKIKGLSFVAPPKPFTNDPMLEIKEIHANWIAIIPYAFASDGFPEIKYASKGWQWWGEQPDGVKESIRLAKQHGIKVMLKPQIYMHNVWVGDLDFKTEEDWELWEKSYSKYIIPLVKIAAQSNVEIFCIGTEFNIAAIKRISYWKQLILEIRKIYNGKLVYSTNWDHIEQIPFWEDLDFIGINAYFPLDYSPTPQKEVLMEAWKPIKVRLGKFSEQKKKKIIFTEYGYLSVDGCAGKTWELEKNVESLAINQNAQAIALDALHETFNNEIFWEGGFLWKWFPNGQGHEGYPEKDYTPQGKTASSILKQWFLNY